MIRLKEVLEEINDRARLVAVSKKQSNKAIMEAYDFGQRDFGENYVQELVLKAEILPKDIHWHMIGHLQSNKVKYIIPFVHLIHSVDSLKLLKEIDKQARKINRTVSCLLQVHIATEDSKTGFDKQELLEILENEDLMKLKGVRIVGLMGMASFTENEEQINEEFNALKDLFDELKEKFGSDFCELSMGMSSDWPLAVKNGSTLLRIGSSIFGTRK